MAIKKKYRFFTATLKFCIVGLFIPGFTAVTILGLQMGVGLLGIECSNCWTIVWTITTLGAVIAPFVFVRLMNKRLLEDRNLMMDKLIPFNVIEYTFIQCTLAMFLTNGKTLCYGSGGQNGVEFAFTGWMALPFLIVLSLVFDNVRERKTNALKANNIFNE